MSSFSAVRDGSGDALPFMIPPAQLFSYGTPPLVAIKNWCNHAEVFAGLGDYAEAGSYLAQAVSYAHSAQRAESLRARVLAYRLPHQVRKVQSLYEEPSDPPGVQQVGGQEALLPPPSYLSRRRKSFLYA